MNSEAVMIGGTRVTFAKVEESNCFFEHVASKKILKQIFLLRTQEWTEWDWTHSTFGYNMHTTAACYGLDSPGILSCWI